MIILYIISSFVLFNACSLLLVILICVSLEVRHGLLLVGPAGQGGQGPGVGLHVIGAEQQQRAEVEEAHVSWPHYGCGDSSPAILPA